jgi:hypothetical protein
VNEARILRTRVGDPRICGFTRASAYAIVEEEAVPSPGLVYGRIGVLLMNSIEQLIIDLKDSLEREIRDGFSQMNTRFDNQAARLDRHAALLQTGSRWTNRMNKWAEQVDAALEKKDREIAELRARLDRLERR